MSYLTFVVIVVPVLIGLGTVAAFGPDRGIILGAVLTAIAVLMLLLGQVSPPQTGPGSETGRLGYAAGLMRFELIRWAPSFLVGAAVGAIFCRLRRSRSGTPARPDQA